MQKHTQVSIALLRIGIGCLLLISGIDKLNTGFTASGFLLNATQGPFAELYQSLANNVLIDGLVVWGEILIGIALILGVAVRFASLMGILMMILFYLAVLPAKNGPISQHIIYILVFVVLVSVGAGKYYGLDKYIEEFKLIKKHKLLIKLLG